VYIRGRDARDRLVSRFHKACALIFRATLSKSTSRPTLRFCGSAPPLLNHLRKIQHLSSQLASVSSSDAIIHTTTIVDSATRFVLVKRAPVEKKTTLLFQDLVFAASLQLPPCGHKVAPRLPWPPSAGRDRAELDPSGTLCLYSLSMARRHGERRRAFCFRRRPCFSIPPFKHLAVVDRGNIFARAHTSAFHGVGHSSCNISEFSWTAPVRRGALSAVGTA